MAEVVTNKPKKPAAAAASRLPDVREATPEELIDIVDWQARRYLGIGGDEFLRRWFGGYYAADVDQPGVIDCGMLAPIVEDYWRKRQHA
jgi:hypothetical protein